MVGFVVVMLLLALFAATNPAPTDVRFVSNVVAAEFATQKGFEVLTADDLRQVLTVESERQMLGCSDESSSCLAELAAAMDARLLVYGSVDNVDGQLLLQLNVFDARKARSLGRVTKKAANRAALVALSEEHAAALAATARAQLPGDEAVRVLVLDIQFRSGASEMLVDESAAAPVWGIAAGVLGAVGVLALAGGGFADFQSVALHADTTAQTDLARSAAVSRYAESDAWALGAVLGYGAGAVLLVAAGVAVTMEVME
jgi:hypothetical protein